MGRFNYLKQDYTNAYTYLDSSLQCNNNDDETEQMYIDLLLLIQPSFNEPLEALDYIDSAKKRHVQLLGNDQFHVLRSNTMLSSINYYLQIGDYSTWNSVFIQFIQEFPVEKKHLINAKLFEKIISDIAIYLFKERKTRLALEFAETGLTYYPNSRQLQRIKTSLSY